MPSSKPLSLTLGVWNTASHAMAPHPAARPSGCVGAWRACPGHPLIRARVRSLFAFSLFDFSLFYFSLFYFSGAVPVYRVATS
jgi:hypothetical protein